MFRGFSRDVKLIFKLMVHIDTYNKTNMMFKKHIYMYLHIYYSLVTINCGIDFKSF